MARSYRIYGALIPLLLLASPALGVYYTYSEWERLSGEYRMIYIAGAMDTLMIFAVGDEAAKVAIHYHNCLKNARMSNRQLADNVQKHARARPELRGGAVQEALVSYVNELCGLPEQ